MRQFGFAPNQNSQEIDHEDAPLASSKPQQKHQNLQYQSLAIFVLIISIILIFKFFSTNDTNLADAQFYNQHLMSFQLIQFWKRTEEEMIKEQSVKGENIIHQSQHAITREQLGHQSWSFLHMVTGGFPQNFDDNLRKKFNTFLVLFGQMYPCKLCANHFMKLLQQEGLFTGNTKKDLMQYLCRLHNKVNERLKHPIYDCSNAYTAWNTCGCSADEP